MQDNTLENRLEFDNSWQLAAKVLWTLDQYPFSFPLALKMWSQKLLTNMGSDKI